MSQRRHRARFGRELEARIRAACPSATMAHTGSGHLKVTGPAGTCFVPSDPGGPGVWGKTRSKLRRKAGIVI